MGEIVDLERYRKRRNRGVSAGSAGARQRTAERARADGKPIRAAAEVREAGHGEPKPTEGSGPKDRRGD